jgi:hypothetical protein
LSSLSRPSPRTRCAHYRTGSKDHHAKFETLLRGPHPRAGLKPCHRFSMGAIYDRNEGGILNAGEMQWMTAGSGIIHIEDVKTKGKVRANATPLFHN